MKKLTTILTATLLFFAASAFAYIPDEVPAKVQNALQKDFANASEVNWEKGENLYFATFSWNTTQVRAVFNVDGELLSTTRKLTLAQVPLKISLAVAKKYKGYAIMGDAVEIIADDQTSYQLSISNGVKTIALTSSANGDLETVEK
ncbi:hypothetical protein [Ferruginibacter albus]|uniref:hypothetical protein n=1 Tax=Ferruginibacter albus TaxID=2875540 RepID=UPI001CC454B6|nr:hypothetical protein [Ferruginibacter albus]UAY51921.1 hypothetical protein K9M53_15185 [Ferruginibacter albus]